MQGRSQRNTSTLPVFGGRSQRLVLVLLSLWVLQTNSLPSDIRADMSVSTSVARHYNRMRANLHHIPSILECKVRKLETALLSLRGGGEAESTQKADPQIKAVSSISAATAPASPRKWEPTPAADFHDSVNIGVLFVLGLGALYALFTSNETLHMLLTYVGFLYIALDLVKRLCLPTRDRLRPILT